MSHANRIRAVSINSVQDDDSHTSGTLVPDTDSMDPLDSYLGGPSWKLTELLQQIPQYHDDPFEVLRVGNQIASLLADYPDLRQDLVLQNLINRTQFMMAAPVTEVRALWFRILRYSVASEDSLYILTQNKLLIILIVSLSTHNSFVEKSEALKLVYRFLTVDNGSSYLSIGVVKAVMCIIDFEEERFPEDIRDFAIQLVLEVALKNPKLIHHAKGFTLFVNLLQDGTVSHCANSLMVIINLLECSNQWPSSMFLKTNYSLNSLISIFDQDYKKLPHFKLQKTCFILTVLFKNWSGLVYLSKNRFKLLGDLIQNLRKSNPKIRDYILDTFLDLLGIRILPWLRSSSFGKLIEAASDQDKLKFNYSSGEVHESDNFFNHYANHYRGLLAFILIKLDLFEVLTTVVKENPTNSDKAILLASNLYRHAKIFLPPDFNLNLPQTISLGSLIKIENISLHTSTLDYQNKKWSNVKASIKHLSNEFTFMDDLELKAMINNTKVLTIKEFNDWNWTLILRVFQGPFKSEKRFNELLERQPKFFKRLLSFYRPFKFRFCNISTKNRNFKKIIQVGVNLFEVFSTYSAGLKYFFRNKILLQMCEIFAQVDKYSGITAQDQILNENRLTTTMSIGYLKFVGKLSETKNGLGLLHQWQFFQLFSNIIENSADNESNNYLLVTLFSYVSYKVPNTKFRNLLRKLLSVCNKKLQAKVVSTVVPPLFMEDEQFAVKLVMDNIYQEPIADKMIEMLYSYYLIHRYEDEDFINRLIGYNPPINILLKHIAGEKLLLNLLKTSNGFRYLNKFDYIELNFKNWQDLQPSFEMLKHLEGDLINRFYPYVVRPTKVSHYDFFLASMLESQEGLNYFQNFNLSSNFLNNLLVRIRQNYSEVNSGSLNNNDHRVLLKTLKQDLWTIGIIFASKFGIKLFDSVNLTEANIFSMLIDIWQNSNVWSLRGVAFFQLSNAAMNNDGIEILDELGWITVVDRRDRSKNFCYPKDLDLSMFEVAEESSNNSTTPWSTSSLLPGLTNDQVEIINLINNFSSFLSRVEKSSRKDLLTIKKSSECFSDVDLFLAVIRIVDNSHFSYTKRNFIFNLFIDDRSIFDAILKKRK